MLCSFPLYAALKKKYPGSTITLVASKTNYKIPFKELNPYVDTLLILDRSSLKTTIGFIKELRKKSYQIGIVPSTIKISRTSHIINYISGAKTRVGVKSADGKKNPFHFLLNVKSDFTWKDTHQTERNLDVIKQINCDLTGDEIKYLNFRFTKAEFDGAKKFIVENFPDKNKIIVGFHPGAGKTDNIWKAKNFIALINKFNDRFKNYVLLTSGWTDDQIINGIKSELNKAGIYFKVLHNYPIKKLGAILSLIDLYITNDTGTMHIAGFSGAKIVSLFGPTNPMEWAPWGDNQLFIKSGTNNINDISVSDVYKTSVDILNNADRRI